MGNDITDKCDELREKLLDIEKETRLFSTFLRSKNHDITGDIGECIANSILSIRHIEDARMRLGKVIQYLGDGVSKFDK
ncbi:hypothetical protein EOM39_03355 [Candidatus Gracilibacteria bacterium]|nr:hypothetical protein [Candidatus Gracilibacteria bacterium]